jgi:hypothetical protein
LANNKGKTMTKAKPTSEIRVGESRAAEEVQGNTCRTGAENLCKESASQLESSPSDAARMSAETRHSILVLVELCYDMAEDDFGGEPRSDHYFLDVLRVAEWLESHGVATPRRAIPQPSIRRDTPPPCQATHGSQAGRLKALRAQAEEIKSAATADDSLYFSMRDVADICTTEIDSLESADSEND